MKYSYLRRIYFLSAIAILFSLVLIVRLFLIQVVNGGNYSKMADQQYQKPVADIFSRGSILFQEKGGGLISAATVKTVYVLAMNPNLVRDAESAYQKINTLIPIDKAAFFEKARKINDPYEVIAKTEDRIIGDSARALNLPGISVYKENQRYYPGGRLAAHLLGIVAQDKSEGDRFAGRYGLERFYDNILRRDSSSLYVNFFAEMFSNVKKTVSTDKQVFVDGDIVLSVEPNVESYLGKELASIQDKWSPDSIGGVIVEPKTGRIIAASFLPDFDPGDFTKENPSVFSDPLVENVYEMGSIVKPLTISAGIDAGVIKPDTKYDDTGYVLLSGKRIENHDHKAMGIVDMQAVLDNSLNTGAVFVMKKLGRDKFRSYMESFGLGDKTGIDLPSETHGLVSNLQSHYDVDYATAAFGQGIAVTPIGAIRALSALANGGLIVRPHLADSINGAMGINKTTEVEVVRRVISSQTAGEITGMLVHAFEHGLLGGKYIIKQYSVAAKTGTAQIPDGKKGYSDKTLHSFFGYFPAYNARFLVLLYMVNPKNGALFSSDTLAEPFVSVTKFLLNYYEIPPDR
ncbi:MAG: penicillin-binding protein 2 [Candidatus Vogelbacteria bacterium]|nr:penicillin-binding protein 2 [Candidatus Vogelbacteria bacterium]